MDNFNLSLNVDLLKLSKAGIAKIHGIKCLVVPIEENDLYIKVNQDDGSPRGCYLSMSAWERKEVSQYGDTHLVKQSFSKAYQETHDKAEIDAAPIIGNGKPIVPKSGVERVEAPIVDAQVENESDLPF